jgi:hypothetical protein
MNNWHRNLFDRDHTPDVPMDARLLVIEPGGGAALPATISVAWMKAVGLDRTVERRGLAVVPPGAAQALSSTPGIRVLRPLGPRLRRSG